MGVHNICLVQGVQEKLCFFSQFTAIPPSPECSHHNGSSVQSLLLAGNYFVQPIAAAECAGEAEVANFRELVEKHTIFNEHPVYTYMQANRICTNNQRFRGQRETDTGARTDTLKSNQSRFAPINPKQLYFLCDFS